MQFLFAGYTLDTDRRELSRGVESIDVEPQVFDLLIYLVENRGRVVTKDDLIASVWGGRIVSDSTLTSRINAARKAVGDSGDNQMLIRTIARKGLRFIGDVPIFVASDSADVWANPQLFHLDHQRRPTVVAGVPPDYFSADGQRWGNPLYDWDQAERDHFKFWRTRLAHQERRFDLVRIDHFRGLVGYWSIPRSASTARRPTAGFAARPAFGISSTLIVSV